MITAILIGFEIRFQEIREKEEFQHQENDDQLDDDNSPELFTNGHVFKTLVIKTEDADQEISHDGGLFRFRGI